MCCRSANNRFIHFLEVTAECEKLGQLYGPPTQPAQSGRQHGGYPLAEIWVTRMDPTGRRLQTTGNTTLVEEAQVTPHIPSLP